LGLVGLLCLFEQVQFNSGGASSIASLYRSPDTVSSVFGTAYLIVSLVVLYGLMVLIFTAKVPIRIFCFATLILVVATEFSYLHALGRFTNTFDITAAMTATSEQKADSLAAYVSFAWVPFEIFTCSTGNFVFLYKRGVHFPYEKNYPRDKARWEPVYYFSSQ